MRIGVDARVLNNGISGTGRYLLNILNELENHIDENEYYLFTNSELFNNSKKFKVIPIKENSLPGKMFSFYWLNFVLPGQLEEFKIDILFSSNISIPYVSLNRTKCVAVVHDIFFKVEKKYYPFFYSYYMSIILPFSLRAADKIITVSNYTKKDLLENFNIDHSKVDVVEATADPKFRPYELSKSEAEKIYSKYNLPEKYLLFVGVLEKRKNIKGLLKISDILNTKSKNIPVVIIGKPGHGYSEIKEEIIKRKDRTIYICYVDDDDLQNIYRLAFAFVFPSFYEGFGIPPLEAMQTGIPVISSNTSALLEVVGNGGLLHSPEDYSGFADDIIKLDDDESFYLEMKNKSIQHAGNFNITGITKKLLRIFETLID